MALCCLLLAAVQVRADEGMWLLPYLQKLNIKDMKAKGLKLSAEQIYNLNGTSLKDAIVIFGGGCTGEIVSPNGLVLPTTIAVTVLYSGSAASNTTICKTVFGRWITKRSCLVRVCRLPLSVASRMFRIGFCLF